MMAAAAALAAACYANTVDAHLVFDDTVDATTFPGMHICKHDPLATESAAVVPKRFLPLLLQGAVIDNADVTGRGGLLGRMPGMFTRDFWGNPMTLSLHKSYR
jgi:hypothetical protein